MTASRDDTALLQDMRIGFSHLLPGRPSLAAGDASADAIVYLQDAPVTLRYRVEAPGFAAPTAGELARVTVEALGARRARARVPADRANDTWLASWGVEGAAVSAYDVAPNEHTKTPEREDAFVLVRLGAVLSVTWTYPRGFVDDPAYASFASIAEATMIWDPARWQQHGRVWPDSAIAGPGLYGAPLPGYAERMRPVANALLLPEERARILGVLSSIVGSAGAPWTPLFPETREPHRHAILGSLQNARMRALVDEAFTEVRSAHDLRSLAVLLGRALAQTPLAAAQEREGSSPSQRVETMRLAPGVGVHRGPPVT